MQIWRSTRCCRSIWQVCLETDLACLEVYLVYLEIYLAGTSGDQGVELERSVLTCSRYSVRIWTTVTDTCQPFPFGWRCVKPAKFIILNTKPLVFNTQFLALNSSFSHPACRGCASQISAAGPGRRRPGNRRMPPRHGRAPSAPLTARAKAPAKQPKISPKKTQLDGFHTQNGAKR